jgi:hypothetical protein
MNELLRWTALRVNRQKFLKRGAAATFGVLAGVSAGSAQAAGCPYPCIGPGGSGHCDPCLCSGHSCVSGCGALCQTTTCCCPSGGACWTVSGVTCCDCQCRSGSFGWYCYCYN